MSEVENWREINIADCECRVPVHIGPGGYDLEAFEDPEHLSAAVRYDRSRSAARRVPAEQDAADPPDAGGRPGPGPAGFPSRTGSATVRP